VSKVPAKKASHDPIRMTVSVQHVIVPDTEMRLSRAIDILLANATCKQNLPASEDRKHSKEKPSAQISNRDDSGVRK
jgi:hypothetical protein